LPAECTLVGEIIARAPFDWRPLAELRMSRPELGDAIVEGSSDHSDASGST
jgi:hypothetical protein